MNRPPTTDTVAASIRLTYLMAARKTCQTKNAISPDMLRIFPRHFHCSYDRKSIWNNILIFFFNRPPTADSVQWQQAFSWTFKHPMAARWLVARYHPVGRSRTLQLFVARIRSFWGVVSLPASNTAFLFPRQCSGGCHRAAAVRINPNTE